MNFLGGGRKGGRGLRKGLRKGLGMGQELCPVHKVKLNKNELGDKFSQ